MDPSGVVLNKIWLKTGGSDDQMKFCLGGQQKDVSRSTRQVWGRVVWGVLMGLVDSKLLRVVETKVSGSFLSIRLQ